MDELMRQNGSQEPSTPPPTEKCNVFDLSRTKQAIEQAVRDASQLPEAQRKKKLNALRLKWHPDKHEILREIAEEVRQHRTRQGPRRLFIF